MSVSRKTAERIRDRLLGQADMNTYRKRLQPRPPAERPLKERVPAGNDHTADGLARRQAWLRDQGVRLDALSESRGQPLEERRGLP